MNHDLDLSRRNEQIITREEKNSETFYCCVGQNKVMSTTKERFSANVGQLSLGRNITKTNKALHELVSDEVVIKFDVFGSFTENGVFGYINGSQIVTFDRNGSDGGDSELMQQPAEPRKFYSELASLISRKSKCCQER